MLGLDMADGNVIEEEQRLGAGGEDVVHAHGNEILADRLVTVEDLGEHELVPTPSVPEMRIGSSMS
ncbi:MAG: hypothetical protein ACLTSX_04670 [Collinsella sp.]